MSSAASRRQRDYRARLANGEICLTITVNAVALGVYLGYTVSAAARARHVG
jgi:hypothetical protein